MVNSCDHLLCVSTGDTSPHCQWQLIAPAYSNWSLHSSILTVQNQLYMYTVVITGCISFPVYTLQKEIIKTGQLTLEVFVLYIVHTVAGVWKMRMADHGLQCVSGLESPPLQTAFNCNLTCPFIAWRTKTGAPCHIVRL